MDDNNTMKRLLVQIHPSIVVVLNILRNSFATKNILSHIKFMQ